jgi:hypothetical protein
MDLIGISQLLAPHLRRDIRLGVRMQNSTQDGRIECSRLHNGSLTGSVTTQALQRTPPAL